MLIDKFGREINYLRLAITDRCNLRCSYCMPEHQHFLNREELLSFEEILFLTDSLSKAGINKVRITGGEPFVRKDTAYLIREISKIERINQLSITTNGVLTNQYLNELQDANVSGVNLSLDTLNPKKFFALTKRDEFDSVQRSFHSLINHGFNLKLNVVVMNHFNTDEIYDFIELSRNHPISIRFIEEMPFNGQGNDYSGITWNYTTILNHIEQHYKLVKLPEQANAISFSYRVEGFAGTIGIIPAYSRSLCGSCNRLRVTPTGGLKLCLYGKDVLNVRDLIRSGISEQNLISTIQNVVLNKPINGFEAEKQNDLPIHESMSMIGG
ncbi:GTP 3',8-cyclase MoaA [Solitalea longa]|uniref:GTP 3',8-cyclase n=1 Tax=Solitalea longa TaxID=2079460 RepID=A0A2S5A012_9SPHI|nr:GTP 3',8-cyclase MoaA [Solitalea longa]POY35463.1 GTP 3',8-cyclase MoaA [Solitalea longa]